MTSGGHFRLQVRRAAFQRGIVILDHLHGKIIHEGRESSLVAEGLREALAQIGGEGPRDAAHQEKAAEGQMGQRQIAGRAAQKRHEAGAGAHCGRVGAGCDPVHDRRGREGGRLAGLKRVKGKKPFQSATGQHIFHPGKAMRLLDEARESQIGIGAHRQALVSAFRRGDQYAGSGAVDRGGIEAGADADDKARAGPGGQGAGQDRAQTLCGQPVEGVALGLKVVQEGDRRGAGCADVRCFLSRPLARGC